MRCPHCQEFVPDGAVYCHACGRRVIGWRGSTAGGAGRPSVDASEETRKVPPDPRLLEAAGRAPSAARCMAPDSQVLGRIRQRTGSQASSPGALAGGAAESQAGGGSSLGAPAPPASSAGGSGPQDTSFYLEEALHGRRPRLTVLMLADACLLLVGVYLIVSWARLTPRRSPEPPPRAAGSTGYISWEEDGQSGSIATGPVKATFQGAPGSPGMGPGAAPGEPERPAGPREPGRVPPDGPPPVSARPADGGAQGGPSRVAPAREPPSREEPRRLSPPREAPVREVAEAAERLKTLKARDQFLKEIPGQVRAHQKQIRRCYQQVLSLRQGVQGDVDVEFEVASSGRVTRATLGRNTTGSATLGSCVTGVFLGMKFSSPPGGPVVLRYPFRFAPQKR